MANNKKKISESEVFKKSIQDIDKEVIANRTKYEEEVKQRKQIIELQKQLSFENKKLEEADQTRLKNLNQSIKGYEVLNKKVNDYSDGLNRTLDISYAKYLKYKFKYLELKSRMNE